MTRQGMISPDVVAHDMARARRLAFDVDHIAVVIITSYEEAYEASLSQGRSGESQANRRGAPIGDPTGDVATSGLHARMRWRVRRAGRELRKALEHLELAESEIVEMFAETDPEMRERLRRLRELEAAAIGDAS